MSGSAAQDFNQLLGTTGVALTPLRPAGTAQLAGKRWAVVTEGEYVASGTDVIVIQVEGQRILVKKKPRNSQGGSSMELLVLFFFLCYS